MTASPTTQSSATGEFLNACEIRRIGGVAWQRRLVLSAHEAGHASPQQPNASSPSEAVRFTRTA
jgi:hypothetical protein